MEYILLSMRLLPPSVTDLGKSPFRLPWTCNGICDVVVLALALALATLDLERDGRWQFLVVYVRDRQAAWGEAGRMNGIRA
jgi:hypothetical protein